MVSNGRTRNILEHILGILMYSYRIKCSVLHCFAMQCSFQACKLMLNGDLLYVYKSIFSLMNMWYGIYTYI
jgi:hypothetical protein